MEVQVKYLQSQLGQLPEEKRSWNRSPKSSHTRVDSNPRGRKTVSRGIQPKRTPLEDPVEDVKATLDTSKLISLNLKANWIRITSWIVMEISPCP